MDDCGDTVATSAGMVSGVDLDNLEPRMMFSRLVHNTGYILDDQDCDDADAKAIQLWLKSVVTVWITL